MVRVECISQLVRDTITVFPQLWAPCKSEERAPCIKHSNANQHWSLQAPRALAPPDRDASVLQQNLEAGMTLHFTSLMSLRPGVSDSHLLCLRLLSPCPASLGTIEQ